jgi:5'-nucleotidase/UDP-sugar diphosphatase
VTELRKELGGVGVSANVRPASGDRLFDRDHIITVGGLRVGVTGVTGSGALLAPRRADNLQAEVAKWTVDDPLTALRPVLQDLRKKSDVVVLLAHLSIEEGRPLLEQLDEVDVVILGHNPGMGFGGERWGRATVLRTGHKGTTVPVLRLDVSPDSVKVIDTVFHSLAPGDPFVADMQTRISLFEQEISSLRQKAGEANRANRRAGGAARAAEEAAERSADHDH